MAIQHTVKHIPMPFKEESDEAYEARLKKLGITDEDFDEAFESDMPLSNSDITTATFHDPEDEDDIKASK